MRDLLSIVEPRAMAALATRCQLNVDGSYECLPNNQGGSAGDGGPDGGLAGQSGDAGNDMGAGGQGGDSGNEAGSEGRGDFGNEAVPQVKAVIRATKQVQAVRAVIRVMGRQRR